MALRLISVQGRSLLGEKLDSGIEPIVLYLNARGIGTLMSCDGHGKEFPWIAVADEPLEKLAKALADLGLDGGFTLSRRYDFTRSNVARVSWRVEFWCLPDEFERARKQAEELVSLTKQAG